MRRRIKTLPGLALAGASLVFAGAAAVGTSPGSATAAGTSTSATPVGAPPRAQLKGFDCRHALDPQDRQVSVKAVMRPLPGTQKLQLKFDLLAATAGAPSVAIHGGDLGVWSGPRNPTLGQLPGDVWNYVKTVVDLNAPATYQFRVAFRWIGAGGKSLGSTVRLSKRCRQRELRPDLQVVAPIAVTAIPSRPTKDLYTATIRNAGNSAAGPFSVLFVSGDGQTTITHDVPLLRAGKERVESFVGPLCSAAGPPTITADSTGVVDDLDRSNNALTATCPAPGSTSASRYTRHHR